MLPILGASSDMLSRQGLLPFGFLAHLRGATLRTTAPGGNCMLSTHDAQSIASYVHVTLVLHDGCVLVTYLGTLVPYTEQKGLHAVHTENPPSLRTHCQPLSGAPRP